MQAVTHPSSNRAQCQLTMLMKANAIMTTLCRYDDDDDDDTVL